MPHLIIIAGCNGAGKTSTAPALLHDSLQVNNFVNADVIAQGLCAFEPEKAAIQAGRIMLTRIRALAQEKVNFAFETTLSNKTFSNWLPQLKEQGYQIHVIFLWLDDVELAIYRVKERVKAGGHSIPEATIRRRYVSGLKNFFCRYRLLANSWQFYDNSKTNQPSLIASEFNHNELIVKNRTIWEQLLETYSE